MFFGYSEQIGIDHGDDELNNNQPIGLTLAIISFGIIDIGLQLVQAPLRALLADTVGRNWSSFYFEKLHKYLSKLFR